MQRRETGSVVVEFGLIFPVIALLIGGLVTFGHAYGVQLTLNHAAREGVRSMALGEADPAGVAVSSAPGLDGSSLSVTTSGRCDPARPEDIGREVGVTVSYRVDLPFPILFDGVSQLRAQAVMRCGG